eukprot:s4534_g4.t2
MGAMLRLNGPRNSRSPAGGPQRPSWPVGRLALSLAAVWTLTCGGAFTSGFRRASAGFLGTAESPRPRAANSRVTLGTGSDEDLATPPASRKVEAACSAVHRVSRCNRIAYDRIVKGIAQVLEISPDAGARKAYRKLAAKYHPDVDSSPEATDMFQKVVRALAIITGEDNKLDETTLLTNAANNLRNNIEFQKERIERLKQQAAEEEKREQQKKAEEKRDQVSAELGLLGGGLLGLVAGGPTGLLLGAIAGIALSKRNDSLGKVIRGTGTFTRGMVDAVNKAASNEAHGHQHCGS